MKSDKITYLTDIDSESGDLYKTIGHQSPTVEIEVMVLRIYFIDKVAIDIYSEAGSGLKLKKRFGIRLKNNKKKDGVLIISQYAENTYKMLLPRLLKLI